MITEKPTFGFVFLDFSILKLDKKLNLVLKRETFIIQIVFICECSGHALGFVIIVA